MDKRIDKIKNNILEKLALIILSLWTISPIIEYIFKYYYRPYYTKYFIHITRFIGIYGIMLYVLYLITLKNKQKLNIKQFIPEIFLFILLIISTVATILSKNPHLSFYGEHYRKEGLLVYILYIGFILLTSIIKNNKYITYLLKSMLISCLIITIMPLLKNDFTYYRFSNIFHNLNHYGYYLMINTMIAIFMFINSNKLYKKIIYTLIYIFFLYLLIRNNTFGSYLAIFITLVFLFIYSIIKKYNRFKIIYVIVLFILTSLIVSKYDIKLGERIYFKNTNDIVLKNIINLKKDIKGFTSNNKIAKNAAGSYRGVLWSEAWKYTLKHPIIGGGMECLREYYIVERNEYYKSHSDRPHNIILQVSSFIGIPGAIIYLSLIIYLAITNLIIMKDNTINIAVFSTAMCYFISSLFGNSMYYTSPYFMILLGMLISFNRHKKITPTK